MNLTLIFGEESNLPFYYRKLAGNIPDSNTVHRLLEELDILGYSKLKLVIDRGFNSEVNINQLDMNHVKFLISVRISLAFIRKELDSIYDTLPNFENYNDKYELYCQTVRTTWHYSQERPSKGETLQKERRLYIHYYYNIEKAADDKKAFDRKLNLLKLELEAENRIPEHEKLYLKYFTCKTTPERGTKATVKEDAVNKVKRYFGIFSFITNETMDVVTALELYLNKDVVEKAFGNLKERLNMRRALVSSEQSLDGKLFVQFVALIYLSYIKKQMQVTDLLKKCTLPSLLDKLDVIECFEQPGRSLRVGEILDEQKLLYHELGVSSPNSL